MAVVFFGRALNAITDVACDRPGPSSMFVFIRLELNLLNSKTANCVRGIYDPTRSTLPPAVYSSLTHDNTSNIPSYEPIN